MKQITTDPGAVYCVYTTTGCTVTDTVTGCTLMTAEPGQPNYFAATGHSVTLSDADATCLRPRFKTAPAALRLLGGGADKLPAGYTRLEFLESTGTQYIMTGFFPDDSSVISLDCNPATAPAGLSIWLFANADADRNETGRAFKAAANKDSLYFEFGSYGSASSGYINPPSPALGLRRTILLKNGLCDTGLENYEFPKRNFKDRLVELSIFRNLRDATVTTVDIYSCLLSKNSKTERHFIPALDPTGTPCMYDLETREPFFNAGSGQFVAGVGTVAQLRTVLRRLPATGGELTLSLPDEANTPEVAEAMQACHDTKGWTLTVHEYRPAAAATYSLRRVRDVVWCRREQSEHGGYVDPTGTRWQIDRCAAIFGALGQDPAAYGYTPFDSVEAAAEEWGLTPYIEPEEQTVSTAEL